MITFDDVKKNKEFNAYIKKGNEILGVLGFTEHSFPHVTKVSHYASSILEKFGYPQREVELVRIAGFIHDIGNCVNRVDHAQTGALMAFKILTDMGMEAEEIADVIGAIGNHDEGAGIPVSPVAAALILADKTDVRRSRVRNRERSNFDIHDRVNYAVQSSHLIIEQEKKVIRLEMQIDTEICSVMDYFEIFLTRMVMCRRAAEFLELTFRLMANGAKLI